MADSFKNSYFYVLPNELLIKIVSHVDTFSLLNFCEAYDCDYFFQDRDVVKTVDLYKKYGLRDLNSLSRKLDFSLVTTLNINCLYWIAPSHLRNFVQRLVNLKNLYAIKTSLSLTAPDIALYNATRVEKLAVTMRRDDEMGIERVHTVKTLYINFIKPPMLLTPLTLDMQFPRLTRVWVDLERPSSGHPLFSFINATCKDKIFCRINAPIPSMNFDYLGLRRYYNNRRTCQVYVMCCEKFKIEELSALNDGNDDANGGEPWEVLDELHCPVPFGPGDARRLYLKEATLGTIRFEELNFHHGGPTCVTRCREAYKAILKSPNAAEITKLCLMTCLLQNDEATESMSVQCGNSFKRKRIGIQSSAPYHSAEDIFENVQHLECLEIFFCHQTHHPSAAQAYPLIAKFEKLLRLTLEIPVTIDGSFLMAVLKNCRLLESLKITSVAQHEKLNFNMCNALPYASSLKDLRFENYRIHLDKLLKCLCVSKKLERLVLICKEIDKFSHAPLKQLVESNPQLTFLYFLIQKATETSLKMAQRTLNYYKKQHPSKVFLVKTFEIVEMGFPVPEVHYCEVMQFESEVATLQPLENFTSF